MHPIYTTIMVIACLAAICVIAADVVIGGGLGDRVTLNTTICTSPDTFDGTETHANAYDVDASDTVEESTVTSNTNDSDIQITCDLGADKTLSYMEFYGNADASDNETSDRLKVEVTDDDACSTGWATIQYGKAFAGIQAHRTLGACPGLGCLDELPVLRTGNVYINLAPTSATLTHCIRITIESDQTNAEFAGIAIYERP